MGRKTITLLCAAAVCLAVALPLAYAGTRDRQAAGAGRCTVSGNDLKATGLPTNTVLNFFVTDADGKDGRVLGLTWDGTWSLNVPDRTSPTTYEFASTTFGKHGSKYWVYASCTADA
jgi:hypothetical protein